MIFVGYVLLGVGTITFIGSLLADQNPDRATPHGYMIRIGSLVVATIGVLVLKTYGVSIYGDV